MKLIAPCNYPPVLLTQSSEPAQAASLSSRGLLRNCCRVTSLGALSPLAPCPQVSPPLAPCLQVSPPLASCLQVSPLAPCLHASSLWKVATGSPGWGRGSSTPITFSRPESEEEIVKIFANNLHGCPCDLAGCRVAAGL